MLNVPLPPMQLILFDIDGTLLRVTAAGRSAIQTAVASVTGESVSTDGISFSGRTDPSILRDVLRSNGLQASDDRLDAILETYAAVAQRTIHGGTVERLPGTASLLSELSNREEIVLGLVTGNIEPVAFHKLSAAELDHHFVFGAFGSDHADRSQLPGLALRRATDHTGHSFSLSKTIVVGDTRHDIRCARDAGAHSVAVATGRPTSSDLSSLAPDLLLENFKNPTLIARKILNVFAEESTAHKFRHDL